MVIYGWYGGDILRLRAREIEQATQKNPEITEAMTQSGASVLVKNCELSHYWARSMAREVFRVMAAAARD